MTRSNVIHSRPTAILAKVAFFASCTFNKGVTWCNRDATKVLYDLTKVLQECNAVTWFNKDVIKVLRGCNIV